MGAHHYSQQDHTKYGTFHESSSKRLMKSKQLEQKQRKRSYAVKESKSQKAQKPKSQNRSFGRVVFLGQVAVPFGSTRLGKTRYSFILHPCYFSSTIFLVALKLPDSMR
jgi:hypothetical protein